MMSLPELFASRVTIHFIGWVVSPDTERFAVVKPVDGVNVPLPPESEPATGFTSLPEGS